MRRRAAQRLRARLRPRHERRRAPGRKRQNTARRQKGQAFTAGERRHPAAGLPVAVLLSPNLLSHRPRARGAAPGGAAHGVSAPPQRGVLFQ